MANLIYFLISFGLMALFFFVMAFMYLFMLRNKVRWQYALIAGFVYCLVITGGVYLATAKASGQDPAKYMAAEVQKTMDKSLTDAEKTGATKQELEMIKSSIDMFIIRPMPAWMLISSAFLVLLVYFIVRIYALNKYGINDGMPPFEVWRAGEPVMWLFILCMAGLVFQGALKNETVTTIAYNGTFVLSAFYFTMGLAVVSYMFIRFKVPAAAKFFFYLMLVLWSFSGIIVILAGVLDTWFNFRKLDKGGSIWK